MALALQQLNPIHKKSSQKGFFFLLFFFLFFFCWRISYIFDTGRKVLHGAICASIDVVVNGSASHWPQINSFTFFFPFPSSFLSSSISSSLSFSFSPVIKCFVCSDLSVYTTKTHYIPSHHAIVWYIMYDVIVWCNMYDAIVWCNMYDATCMMQWYDAIVWCNPRKCSLLIFSHYSYIT